MTERVRLVYGTQGLFEMDCPRERLALLQSAPAPCQNLAEQLLDRLQMPLELPPLVHFFTPGDRAVFALDRHTPEAATLIATLWNSLAPSGLQPSDLVILQPAGLDGRPQADPRTQLPEDVRSQIVWKTHDATDETARAYLASSSRGDRIYLARELVESDVVVSIGTIAYDAVIGYRGTSSVFYPSLSSVEAIQKLHGQGHSELGPEDDRPLRQEMDEVAWLLGNMFTVQVIPSRSKGVVEVLAGASDAVLTHGKELLAQEWRVSLDRRVPLVVVAIEEDDAGHGWAQVGAALETARNLVTKGGRIVVLTELTAPLTPGLDLLRASRDARSALQPLRKRQPPDMVSAIQIAQAADWARVSLLSRLDPSVAEELFLFSLESEREVVRLLEDGGPCAFIESAQHTYGEIVARERRRAGTGANRES